jgi:hypothetical protein
MKAATHMSYECKMLEKFSMPTRREVERALLKALLAHGGVIREFATGQLIVDQIADGFAMSQEQRSAFLETTYRKENRVKKSLLWHRLLFRAADSLATENLVTRPTQTIRITNNKEWMLTEKGFDEAIRLCNIAPERKKFLEIRSYEVEKIVKRIRESRRPVNYNPIDPHKKVKHTKREALLRARGFRQAVVQAYGCRCAVCGLKLAAPDSLVWEVEAAHIVPHSSMGRDDIWNGIALCSLHHWAFDVGWFTLRQDYIIEVSPQAGSLATDSGRLHHCELIPELTNKKTPIILPEKIESHPHANAIAWHRENIFHGR